MSTMLQYVDENYEHWDEEMRYAKVCDMAQEYDKSVEYLTSQLQITRQALQEERNARDRDAVKRMNVWGLIGVFTLIGAVLVIA